MKIKVLYAVATLGLLLSLTACEKFVDEPESSTQINLEDVRSVGQLDQLLTGGYSGIAREAAFSGNAVVIGETFGDLVAINNTVYRTSPSRSSRVYTWTHREEEYGWQAEFLQWSTFGLTNANNVLEVIGRNQVPTETGTDPRLDYTLQRGRLEGEARLLRSLCIFEQIRLLGYPWGTTPDNSQPGPIGSYKSFSGFEDLAYPRLSVKAAYDSVLNDLRTAERLLPEAYDPARHPADFQPRGNKFAALGLMARVYWQQDNVDSCLAVLNRLLGPGSTYRFPLAAGDKMLPEIWQRAGLTPTTNSASRSEVIFELVHVVGRNPRTVTNAPIRTHYVLQTPYTPAQLANVNTLNSGPNYRLSQRFKTLAAFDRGRDLRYRTLIDTTQAATASTAWDSPNRLWFPLKWGGRGTASPGPAQGVNMNVTLMRSAEFILMRAEMLARKDQSAAALTDLNAIRTRAGLAALAAAPTDLVAEIRRETVRELFVEGQRIYDLKRRKENLVVGDRALSPGSVDCAASGCANVPWNSRLLVFVVPQVFLDRNPLAVQND